MPRQCPDCGADLESDGVHAWCCQFACTFEGYVVVRTGKIIREQRAKTRK